MIQEYIRNLCKNNAYWIWENKTYVTFVKWNTVFTWNKYNNIVDIYTLKATEIYKLIMCLNSIQHSQGGNMVSKGRGSEFWSKKHRWESQNMVKVPFIIQEHSSRWITGIVPGKS